MKRATIGVLLPVALTIHSVIVLAAEPEHERGGDAPAASGSAAAPAASSAVQAAPGSSASGAAPAAPASSASVAAASGTAPAADANLLAELQAAAGADATAVTKQNAASGGASEVPATDASQLGKGVVGNETNPAIALIVTAVGAWFSQGNRIHQEGESPKQTGPDLQGTELSLQAPVDPFFRVAAAVGLYPPDLEEAYAQTTALPWNLQVRAGKFRSLVGRHNALHSHQWTFAAAPLANDFLFGSEGLSAPGGELSVLMPLPWYVELIGAVQAADSAGSFRFRTPGSGEPTYRDFTYPVRLVQFFDLSDDWALQVGANTVQGRSSMGQRGADRAEAYAGDLFLKWRPIGQGTTGYKYIATTVEGWYRKMDVPGGAWRDAGGYAEVTFGLSKQWDTGVRGDLWRRLDRDSEGISLTDRLPYGIDVVRGTAQLSFIPSHFSRVRAQYSFEHSELFPNNHIALLQLEVAAGAHGAHTY